MVPELRIVMKNAMERLTGKSFLAVGTGIKTGLDIRTDNPASWARTWWWTQWRPLPK